ncbi:MAG: biotin--[acetyl-CoA-carboxylase] ligase [Candidatus Caenarcaniphilales bacterium]|nr:biotin--[acetyl-CoA-carboxylase] ligase [Candidatus Caenarcaniphilales bacterium]
MYSADNLIYFSQTSSTNDQACLYPHNSILIAETQASGRGRQGRQWISSRDGLYFTYRKEAHASIASTGLLSLIAGIALHQVLSEYDSGLKLKWSNDLLNMKGQKLAGILIERKAQMILIGVGVNLSSSQELPESASSLSGNQDKIYLALKILDHIQACLKLTQEQVVSYWQEHSFFKSGDLVNITQNDSVSTYQYLGINQEGGLKLLDQGGLEKIIYSGEVQKVRLVVPK